MGAEDLSKVLRQSGKLCHTPLDADFTGSHPFGGTDLGLVARIYCTPGYGTETIVAEEFGVEVVETIETGEAWIIGANLRQWDDDAVALVARNTSAGASEVVMEYNASSTRRAGMKGSDRAVKLVFSPRDVSGKGAVFYRAVPFMAKEWRFDLTVTRELVFPIMFRCLRAGNGKVYEIGTMTDLSMT